MIYGRQIGGVVQNCSNSITNSLELKQSCTKPSKYRLIGSYNRNTLWLRDSARQTSRGKSMTSSNGNIFRVTGHLCGEFTGPGEFPTQRPLTRSFDVFFDLRLNKRLSKQPWGWWFETPSCSLWRHRNANADAPMVLCSERFGDLVTNYLPICVWRRLPRELMSPVKWSSRAVGPSLSSISQGLHMAHKKPEHEYGFIPYLLVKKITSKSPVYLSIDALLSPPLGIVRGFLSGPRVSLQCSNERLEYYATHGKPLWRQNAFCDVINAQSRQNKRAHP